MRVRIASSDAWLRERVGCSPTVAIEAVDEAGQVAGMVGFEGWTPNSVTAHVAVERPALCRGLLFATFDFAFNVRGRGVLHASVRASNGPSLALARGCGMREVARLRDAYQVGEDVLFFELRREECRWLSRVRKAA